MKKNKIFSLIISGLMIFQPLAFSKTQIPSKDVSVNDSGFAGNLAGATNVQDALALVDAFNLGGSPVWGGIGGSIANQIDLNNALNGKLDAIADPNANSLYGWDDTDNAYKFLNIGSGLSYDHATHTLSATGGSSLPADATGWLHDNGAGVLSWTIPTKTDVGLSNVPNTDATNAANISTGTLPDGRLSGNVTLQGNTFNGNSELVKTDVLGKLPAIDGSALTGLSMAQLGYGIVTTVGSPGTNTNLPTEAAVRAAISGAGGGNVSGPASSTTDDFPSFFDTTGKLLKDSGVSATLFNLHPKSGSNYGAIGIGTGDLATDAAPTSSANVAIGNGSLSSVTTGTQNVCVGSKSCQGVVDQQWNTALGDSALSSGAATSAAIKNTAVGANTQISTTSGTLDTSLGYHSLVFNTTGSSNTAIGVDTLYNNTTGSSNTAIGVDTLYNNTTGSNNTAVGKGALGNTTTSTTGDSNTVVGSGAANLITTGSNNTVVGKDAGTVITSGSSNTYVGYQAGFTGARPQTSNSTAIGATSTVQQDNAVVLGNSSVTSLGIGDNLPTYNLSFLGTAAKTIGMERHTTSNTAGNTLTLSAGGATVSGSISTVSSTPTAGGTGYTKEDLLTISTGNGDATVAVTGVSGGVVTSVALIKSGSGYSVATGQATTGGTGTGCTINVTGVRTSTDKSGGNLILQSGTSTGSGSSNVLLKATGGGSTGNADSTPATIATISSSGLTVTTGKNITVGSTQWNSGDSIDATKAANANLGDVSTSSGAWTVNNAAITLAKMANLAANSILGNNTGASATPIALTAAQVKALLSLNNVENTALSTWAGSANLVTLGTVTSGTWHGTPIADAYLDDAITVDNSSSGKFIPQSGTFASIPGAPSAGQIYVITDAASSGDCTAGGGSARALCRYNGSAWQAIGDGGSGGAETNNLETVMTGVLTDEVPVGTSADAATYKALPSCSNSTTSKLLYDTTTHAFSCGTDQTGGGSGTVIPSTDDFRITLTSGTPITSSDVTAASTIYLTPYKGQEIATYDSSTWTYHSSSEISLALSGLTSGSNYDVFVYNNAGTLTLELSSAWTNDTTRADAIAQQDGVWVKSSDHSRRCVATIRTTGTTTTEDSARLRYVWNFSNRVRRPMYRLETTLSWTYTTEAWREANGSSLNQLEVVSGLDGYDISVIVHDRHSNPTGNTAAGVSVGKDGTTPDPGSTISRNINANSNYVEDATAELSAAVPLGYHYYVWLEESAAVGTCTWYGYVATTIDVVKYGVTGSWES